MAGDESLLPYAGIGGAVVCCAALELLGGAVLLGGLAATVGLSTGLTYLITVGIGGILAAILTLGYSHVGEATHAWP